MKKNVASQVIGAQLVAAADGTAFTGSVTCYVTGDGGTQAAGSVGSGACTHEGNGFHTYAPAQAETNYDHVAFTFTGTGAIPVTIQAYPTFPQTGDSFARLGAPAGASVSADISGISTSDGRITSGTAQAATSTTLQLASGETYADDEIVGSVAVITGGSAGVGQSRVISDYVSSTDTATISPAWTTTPTGTITYAIYPAPPAPSDSAVLPTVLVSSGTGTGQLSVTSGVVAASVAGAVGSVTGNVGGNVVGSVGSVTGNVGGNVAGSVGSVTAGVTLANDAVSAAALAADAIAEINATVDTAISDAALATAANLATVDGIVDNLVSGVIFGAAATGTLSTTQATSNLTGYGDDQLIGRVIIWLTGNCEGEATDITDYASASGLMTFTALTTAPGNGDTFKIV